MNKQNYVQILQFLAAGGVGVLAYYAVLYSLTELIGVWYVLSAMVAFIINYGLNFVLQKFWTFQNRDTKAVPKQSAQYFGMAIGMLITNTACLYALVEYTHFHYLLAQVMLTIALTVASFFITKRIFKT